MAHKVYVNYTEVNEFLTQLTTNIGDSAIKTWFNKRLPAYLMNGYTHVTELKPRSVVAHFKHKDMPTVVQKAMEHNERIYRFKKSAAFANKMTQVVDYLQHLQSKSTNISGMPFDVAYSQSEKWHASFAKPKKRKTVALNLEGVQVIATFDNGCFLAELLSKEQFAYESKMMAHCVESYYGRGYSKILTYRTPDNKPLLTIEVVDKHPGYLSVVQAKGFANRGFIPEEHIKNVLHYFHTLNKTVSYQDCLIFGHLINEKPVIMMPEGTVFKKSYYDDAVEINCCVGLPKNAVFEGNLKLTAAQLPVLQNITVKGNLHIENSLIVAIMDSVQVSGTIHIWQSLTSVIAPHLQTKIRRQ